MGNVEEGGKKAGNPRVGLNWHTDHYHLPEPGLFAFLHAVQVPLAQGESRKAPDVVHPLVRMHPELRRRGLFLGGEWGSSIQGVPEDEGQALFDELLGHLTQDRFGYRHRWQPGDVLMSDKRCSMHRASEWDQASETRRLHRIILVDDVRPN